MVRCAIIFKNGDSDNFKSGEMISGAVEIGLSEETAFRHLLLTIEGFGEIKWPSLTISDNGVHAQFTNAEQYFKETIHLFGCNDPLDENKEFVHLGSGTHTFPFSHQLSTALPASFEGKHGSIRYIVTAVLDTTSNTNIIVVRPFNVVTGEESSLHDVSKYPFVAELSSVFSFCLFWKAKPLFIAASIPQTGYEIGDEILVTVELVNRSPGSVRAISIELVQVVTYKSKAPKEHRKVDERILTKASGPHIGRVKSHVFTCKLAIPTFIVPTQRISCHMIEIYYKINVRLDARFLKITRLHPSLTLPITISIKKET